MAEVLAHASFRRSEVSAARNRTRTSSGASRAPLVMTTRVSSTGVALPTSAPTSDAPCRRSSTGTETPVSASAAACGVWTQADDSTAQDARKQTRLRGVPRNARSAWHPFVATIRDRHRCIDPSQLSKRPTHLTPFSHPAPPRRASPRLGSAEHYAGSTSREAQTSIQMRRTGNLQPDCQR